MKSLALFNLESITCLYQALPQACYIVDFSLPIYTILKQQADRIEYPRNLMSYRRQSQTFNRSRPDPHQPDSAKWRESLAIGDQT